jgi:GntR family transcriptional regulator
MNLDDGSSRPLWAQLSDLLRERINDGQPVGDLSDVSLANEFRVSAGTARQAVQALANEGLLVRRRGIGTVVTARPIQSELNVFGNFMVDWQLQGRTVRVELLERRVEAASMAVAAGLAVRPGELVGYNRRVRHANGLPVVVDHRYIPADLDDGLMEQDFLRESLWRAIQERKGIDPLESRVTVRGAAATEEAVELLGLTLGAPVLNHEMQILDTTGRIIMFGTSTYHPDRFVYSAVQKAAPSGAGEQAASTPSRPLNGLEVRRARKPSTGRGARKKATRRRAPKAG